MAEDHALTVSPLRFDARGRLREHGTRVLHGPA